MVKPGVGSGMLIFNRHPPGDSDIGYPGLKVKKTSSTEYLKPQLPVLGSAFYGTIKVIDGVRCCYSVLQTTDSFKAISPRWLLCMLHSLLPRP